MASEPRNERVEHFVCGRLPNVIVITSLVERFDQPGYKRRLTYVRLHHPLQDSTRLFADVLRRYGVVGDIVLLQKSELKY